ncbi:MULTISPECIES: MFS transporter [unclassified Massilia]|uniref:MFS transporter n=1 Tax=unclassified Massilia TaxID=2609279 RepID=UPI0017816548|nr:MULTISPECIES: MFS transporter [unclassified Massilia]MBD8528536.1 MHS family MFS transporter [Massilia sp. CFBP 13647]MBD8671841.1 MHS family MFS transporter [Massilia sp. CFBP 13721]
MSQPKAPANKAPANKARTVLFASLIGTTIEFFDFYIYATAAVLVFPKLFFPAADPAAAVLQSFATFAIAFFARPVGSALFGHFGDRIGRKATLVAALLTMGVSTIVIGMLPTYASIGTMAPLLLALCRFGQGLGLGGEWGGAVLLATENAPPGKRAWYGMFPQLGAPIGFFLSGSVFLLLTQTLTEEQFFAWGWRVPFLSSAILVAVGLYVRLKIHETPDFQAVLDKNERVKVPVVTVFKEHGRALVLGTLMATSTFVLFYLLTVFALSWGTTGLGYSRTQFLVLQLGAVIFFGLLIPPSALIADRFGRRTAMIGVTAGIMVFGLFFGSLFIANNLFMAGLFLVIGLSLMGLTYGPLGTLLAELFPPEVRYTGSSLTFNLAGILGASLAPYVATSLATKHGIAYVGYYLTGAALLSLVALMLVRSEGRRAGVARA